MKDGLFFQRTILCFDIDFSIGIQIINIDVKSSLACFYNFDKKKNNNNKYHNWPNYMGIDATINAI